MSGLSFVSELDKKADASRMGPLEHSSKMAFISPWQKHEPQKAYCVEQSRLPIAMLNLRVQRDSQEVFTKPLFFGRDQERPRKRKRIALHESSSKALSRYPQLTSIPVLRSQVKVANCSLDSSMFVITGSQIKTKSRSPQKTNLRLKGKSLNSSLNTQGSKFLFSNDNLSPQRNLETGVTSEGKRGYLPSLYASILKKNEEKLVDASKLQLVTLSIKVDRPPPVPQTLPNPRVRLQIKQQKYNFFLGSKKSVLH